MEALLYESLDNRKVRCNLCSHRCIISDRKTGLCRVRENHGGKLETLVYGRLVAREKNLKNIFVTNGYMTPEALHMIGPVLDAANVDLKSFSYAFYKKYCGARLEPVKETIRAMKSMGVFVEVTTLIIPGLNDDPKELADLARFIATEAGKETPWHISRFHPAHRMQEIGPTPVATLTKAREIGIDAGLKYVYTGNVPGDEGENTYCYQCGRILIRRSGYTIFNTFIKENRCPDCGAEIDGVEL